MHISQFLPGVGHVRLSSLTFLQAEFSENTDQHHDGHHSTDNIHDHVCPVPVGFLVDLRDGRRWLPGVCPHWRVIVGAGRLVQTVNFELAAEAVEAGATAEQVDTCVAVERRVPLAHDVVITPASVTAGWKRLVLSVWCGRSQGGLWHRRGLCLVVGEKLGHGLTRRPGAQSTQRRQTQEDGQRQAYQERMHGGGHLELNPVSCDGSERMCNC